MDQPGFLIPLIFFMLLLLTLLGNSTTTYAQEQAKPWRGDSTLPKKISRFSDSIRSMADTLYQSGTRMLNYKKNEIKNRLRQINPTPAAVKNLRNKFKIDTTDKSLLINPFQNLVITKPWVRATEGLMSYQFNYRTAIDTPFLEKDLGQHVMMGRMNVLLGGIAPVTISYLGRRTNSNMFRDINDVQVSFNALAFANSLQSSLRQRLLSLAPQLKDSIAGMLLGIQKNKQGKLERWLNSAAQLQKLVAANEVIRVPRITYDPDLPDSVNEKREESLKKAAATFMELYNKTKEEYNAISRAVDSLVQVYEQSLLRLKRFQQLINGQWNDLVTYRKWKHTINDFGLSNTDIPAQYRWLLGIRTFSLGRSVVNQSELTAKNLRVNGINFEYNSWYYLAVTAGLIDYRFRDFVVSPVKRSPQLLYLLRLGIGRSEGNHLIVSGFRGQKQLFSGRVNRGGLSSITVTGYSVEARYTIHRATYITAEMAESVSPDFRNIPAAERIKIGSADKSNNAYAVRLFSYLPKTGSRLEAMYKYTGANFQSFSSFQTNSGQEAWYIKFDQQLFKRQLRIRAALRSHDFFNPFIVQQYQSNTIFKSVTATFRRRKGPVLTLGYIPMVQITKMDNQLIESRFQTLNASYYHLYRIYKSRAATSLIYNRFYNHNSDSAFLYYNAVNVYGAQNFYFRLFSTGVVASYTKNNNYKLLVMEENVNWNFPQWGALGFGVKVNKYNQEDLKLGGFVNANIRIGNVDMLSVSMEKSYLPGYRGGLVRNEMVTIQFNKALSFK